MVPTLRIPLSWLGMALILRHRAQGIKRCVLEKSDMPSRWTGIRNVGSMGLFFPNQTKKRLYPEMKFHVFRIQSFISIFLAFLVHAVPFKRRCERELTSCRPYRPYHPYRLREAYRAFHLSSPVFLRPLPRWSEARMRPKQHSGVQTW